MSGGGGGDQRHREKIERLLLDSDDGAGRRHSPPAAPGSGSREPTAVSRSIDGEGTVRRRVLDAPRRSLIEIAQPLHLRSKIQRRGCGLTLPHSVSVRVRADELQT